MEPDELFLSDNEEAAAEQIKALLYAPTIDLPAVRSALAAVTGERRAMVLETAVFETSAEQAQRRRYILGTMLNPAISVDQRAAEELIKAIPVSAAEMQSRLTRLGLQPTDVVVDPQTNPQLLSECQLFTQADANLADLQTELLKRQRVQPYFKPLQNLTAADRDALLAQIDQYFQACQEGGKKEPAYNPPLPVGLTTLLGKVGMRITQESLETLGEKVTFLLSVLYVAQAQKESGSGDDETTQTAVARLMYLQNLRPSFEAL